MRSWAPMQCLVALLALLLISGCGEGEVESPADSDELVDDIVPEDPTADNSLDRATFASLGKTLYYEGKCWWLKCTNHNNATGACGYGCRDDVPRLCRDYRSRWSCGRTVKVVRQGRVAWPKVWDTSCCGRMEGNHNLLNRLAIPHGDGACGKYGWGQGYAYFYW